MLRPVTMADAETLLAWRNDPLTRENSLNTDPVPLESHLSWLEASLRNPDRRLLIADGLGTVRADRCGAGWELSWTVAPESRGHGVGRRLVATLIELLPERPLLAEIKAHNLPSIRIAESVGMQLAERRGAVLLYTLG